MRWPICLLAVMRDVLVSVDAFSLHNFRARNIYPDEVSCFFGGWSGGGVTTSFACESWCLFGRCSMSWWDDTLFGCRMFLLMVWCKDGGEVRDLNTCILWCKEVHSGVVCLGWWRECRSFEECLAFFGLSPYCLIRGFFLRAFLFLRVDCACNRPACLCHSV